MKLPILGKQYNSYTVISENTIKIDNDTHLRYKVQCSCGNIVFVRADHLENGRSTCCKNCSSKKTYNSLKKQGKFGFIPNGHKGIGEITKVIYNNIKNGASKRNLEFEVSIEFLWDLYLKQERKCALSGLDIWFTDKRKKSNIDWSLMNASLDRVENNKGYTKDNVQWVHKDYNRFKNNYSMSDFVGMCKKVVEVNKTLFGK